MSLFWFAKPSAKFSGKKLRALRESHKLTQREIALTLGCSDRAVGQWELGKTEPSFSYGLRLAIAFGVSPMELAE